MVHRFTLEGQQGTVAPNPFVDHFTVSTPNGVGEQWVRIYAVNGTMVYGNTFLGPTSNVSLPHLESGMYMLTIVDRHGTLHRQRIIKN